MSKYRKIRDTRDQNHGEIVAFLRTSGIEVIETERPVDCLVYNGEGSGWMEIKTTARNASVRRGQLEFFSETNMPVEIVTSEGDALRFALNLDGWTQKQKDAIAVFLMKNPGVDKFHPAKVEKALGIAKL